MSAIQIFVCGQRVALFLRKILHIILSTDTIDHISDGGILECKEAMTE